MSEEEMRARLEEELKRLSVDDVVVQTAVTLVNLGGRRLGLVPGAEDERDIEQARLAVEAVRALFPLLPEETQPPIRDALSQLQVGFAKVTQEGGPAAAGGAPAGSDADEAERAKARAKIWTPPGA